MESRLAAARRDGRWVLMHCTAAGGASAEPSPPPFVHCVVQPTSLDEYFMLYDSLIETVPHLAVIHPFTGRRIAYWALDVAPERLQSDAAEVLAAFGGGWTREA